MLRKDNSYSDKEIDYLFRSLVLPKITYAISVYGASTPELTTIQCFLDRCFKRRYIIQRVDIHDILTQREFQIFKKAEADANHPLLDILPRRKLVKYSLRRESYHVPKVNSERFKNTFVNRLLFKHCI